MTFGKIRTPVPPSSIIWDCAKNGDGQHTSSWKLNRAVMAAYCRYMTIIAFGLTTYRLRSGLAAAILFLISVSKTIFVSTCM